MTSDDVIAVDFGNNGGVHHFRTYDELEGFVRREREAWSWLFSGDLRDPGNAPHRVDSRLNELRNQINNWKNNNTRLRDAVDNVRSYYSQSGDGLLAHDGEIGERIHLIKEKLGAQPAATAYSFAKGWVQLGQTNSIDSLSAIILLAVPGLADAEGLEARLSAERRNYSSAVRRQMDFARSAEKQRSDQWEHLKNDGRAEVVRWIRKEAVRWRRLRRAESKASESAIESIKSVELAYNEYMKLKAPADYWRKKSENHKTAEGNAKTALYWFFPMASIIVATVFCGVAIVLLNGPRDVETPVYFVLSAGLALFGGLVFWVGRILTRLYLSEHHLRKDAEEREVMTTTYLALTKDAAAEANDRQIILAALFRNSSDGIVKDDGAGEASLAGLLARLGMPRP